MKKLVIIKLVNINNIITMIKKKQVYKMNKKSQHNH